MQLTVEPMRDDPEWNAILYGPIVLAGLLGADQMPSAAPYATGNQLEFRSVPDPQVPTLSAAIANINEWLKKTGPLEFRTSETSSRASVQFVPLANVTKERYSVYWKLS
jgi:hypothetical protein